MTGRVQGRVALVTGAARGMGAAHATLLQREGASVAVCDVDDETGSALASSIGATYWHLDVTDENQWASVVDDVTNRLGPIGILVNNAGISCIARIQDATTEAWNRTIAVNLTGVFFGMRAVVPSMRRAEDGVIVNVSSSAGMNGASYIAPYAASKWGVRGLTKAAALDLADDGIRVLSLHPGMVRTQMMAGIDGDSIARRQAIPRLAEPEEIAKMLLFMVADATYSTGSEFIADGGSTAGTRVTL